MQIAQFNPILHQMHCGEGPVFMPAFPNNKNSERRLDWPVLLAPAPPPHVQLFHYPTVTDPLTPKLKTGLPPAYHMS